MLCVVVLFVCGCLLCVVVLVGVMGCVLFGLVVECIVLFRGLWCYVCVFVMSCDVR